MHGGDIYRNFIRLDFSINNNPLGTAESVSDALLEGVLRADNYPDILCMDLRREIEAYTGVDRDCIVCGNGASELIMALGRFISPGTALLVEPCFSGYERALETVGCSIIHHMTAKDSGFSINAAALADAIREAEPDLVFIANPTNPAGTLVTTGGIEIIAAACMSVGASLIVDECFMDMVEDCGSFSAVPALKGGAGDGAGIQSDAGAGVYIIRAFTKSYAIPGIRLGYVMCPDRNSARDMGKLLPEWNVSLPAQLAGVAALGERKYISKALDLIKKERAYLEETLRELGMEVFKSRANFCLFYYPGEKDLYERLMDKGILIRDCSDYKGLSKGFYRVAVRSPEGNRELITSLAAVLKED